MALWVLLLTGFVLHMTLFVIHITGFEHNKAKLDLHTFQKDQDNTAFFINMRLMNMRFFC